MDGLDTPANLQMEPTRQTVGVILAASGPAAHLKR